MNLLTDRSWMARRKSSSEIGATTEFRAGCQVFLDYAYSNRECVNDKNQIRCPCWKCKNVNYQDRDIVNFHLLVNGFMRNYEEYWWAHGQKRDGGITINNAGSSTYRMNEMVHDFAGPDFNWDQAREQPINADAKDFFKLLDEGSEPLWDGCMKQSKLSAVATLLNIKTDHNMSHECFESLLKAIKSRKPCWFDCHRRFLPVDHPFRRNRENFRKGKVENDMSAPRLSGTEIRSCVMRLPAVPFAYSFNEISTFVSDYFPDEVLTKANRVSRNDDGGNVELNGRLSVFGLSGRAYGKEKRIFLSEKELHAAHTYILLNCEEIDEYVRLYDGELKAKHPDITDKDIEINRAKGFALWIKDKALTVESTIPANVLALAMGPDRDQVSRNGYKVNGYDFHTKAYGLNKRTTNSGVCVQGDCYNELSHAFYGELEEIIELSAGRKRDRPPADWQVVIHTPARKREEVVDGEFYQESILYTPVVINVDDDEIIQLDGGDNPEEIDPQLILVSDNEEEEEFLTDTDSELENGEDDGYESAREDDSDSDNNT
ncbi:hypothetical protein POM88_000551 [Heracleum sosnowskyi]|uniref:Transposase-associated domain-containing protein n=1 Tax=Heracleum sosnowskyi TaxID=360622 RepID=A0AAD8JE59_9APIA|nr:hypothetical protein POM88_000551 [Heracleum sosnowskyi]